MVLRRGASALRFGAGLFPALLCALVLGGCSSSSDGGAQGTAGAAGAAGAGGSGGLACEDSGGALDLTGTWAAVALFSVRLEGQEGGVVQVCPPGQVREAPFFMLLDIHQSETDPTVLDSIQAVPCSLELPTVTALAGGCNPEATNLLSVNILMPPAIDEAFASLTPSQVSGTLSGGTAGATLHAGRMVFTLGSSQPGASMPKWDPSKAGCGASDLSAGRSPSCENSCVDDCSKVVDSDKDSWAGVSMRVCGQTPDDVASQVPCKAENPSSPGTTLQGRVLMDFQVDPQLDGTAKSSCEASGAVDAQVLYNVLGGDVYLTNAQVSVTSAILSLPSIHVVASQSRFRMIRVDGKHGAPDWKLDMHALPQAACSAVAAHKNQLR